MAIVLSETTEALAKFATNILMNLSCNKHKMPEMPKFS